MSSVLPYNSQAPGSQINTGIYADPTGDHWAGTLRGNTDKPPVGCTGIQKKFGFPEKGSIASINGCAGNQWLNPNLQSGGDAYSYNNSSDSLYRIAVLWGLWCFEGMGLGEYIQREGRRETIRRELGKFAY